MKTEEEIRQRTKMLWVSSLRLNEQRAKADSPLPGRQSMAKCA